MSFIRFFDKTGQDYHLFLDNNSKHKTIFGGLFSLSIYILILLYVIQSLSDFIDLKKFTSTYNFYYVSNLNESSTKEVSFNNEYFFKFKLGVISNIPTRLKIENYYRLVIILNDISSIIIPNCENNTTFCFSNNITGWDESFLNYINKIELTPCSQIRNILNPEETKKFYCNPNFQEFDNANKLNIVTVNFNTELISFSGNVEKFKKFKNNFSANLAYGEEYRISGKYEILNLSFQRKDFLFGFENEFKYFNFFKTSEQQNEILKENKFRFSVDFLRNFFSREYIGVHQYKVSYITFSDFLSTFGGLLKIANVLFWLFKFIFTQNLSYVKMFDLIDYSYDPENLPYNNTFNNKSVTQEIQGINSNTNLYSSLKEDIFNKSDLNKNFNQIDQTKSDSYSKKSSDLNLNFLPKNKNNKLTNICIGKPKKNLIKKLFSFENLFSKFREINILKSLILSKDQLIFLNYMARKNYNISNKILIKELNEDYESCANQFKLKIETGYDLTEYDKILIKFLY